MFWRDQVMAAARPDADACLLSCANIAAFGIIDALEPWLERPVVTSNQAALWDALMRLCASQRRSGPAVRGSAG